MRSYVRRRRQVARAQLFSWITAQALVDDYVKASLWHSFSLQPAQPLDCQDENGAGKREAPAEQTHGRIHRSHAHFTFGANFVHRGTCLSKIQHVLLASHLYGFGSKFSIPKQNVFSKSNKKTKSKKVQFQIKKKKEKSNEKREIKIGAISDYKKRSLKR